MQEINLAEKKENGQIKAISIYYHHTYHKNTASNVIYLIYPLAYE